MVYYYWCFFILGVPAQQRHCEHSEANGRRRAFALAFFSTVARH